MSQVKKGCMKRAKDREGKRSKRVNYDLEQKLRERGANLIRQVCKLKYRVSTKNCSTYKFQARIKSWGCSQVLRCQRYLSSNNYHLKPYMALY